jgi:hypothetical protein
VQSKVPVSSQKDVMAAVAKENPTWKIPARRFSKFLKREQASRKGVPLSPESGADDSRSVTSTSSSVSRSVKKLASKTKKKLFGKSGSSKASVASSSMGGSSKGSFNFFKKSSKNMSSAPAEIQVESAVPMKFSKETALPQMETEKEEEDLLPPPPPPVVKEEAPSVKVVEPSTADEPVSQNRGIVYQDDNTGKKDDQLCGGNCVVM